MSLWPLCVVLVKDGTCAAARQHARAMVYSIGKHDNAAAVRGKPRPKGPDGGEEIVSAYGMPARVVMDSIRGSASVPEL